MPLKKEDKRDVAFIGALGRGIAVKRTNKSKLAQRIGTSRSTFYNWWEHPSLVPLGHLRILARELELTDEEILSIIKK